MPAEGPIGGGPAKSPFLVQSHQLLAPIEPVDITAEGLRPVNTTESMDVEENRS